MERKAETKLLLSFLISYIQIGNTFPRLSKYLDTHTHTHTQNSFELRKLHLCWVLTSARILNWSWVTRDHSSWLAGVRSQLQSCK